MVLTRASYGSLYAEKQALWAPAYEARLKIIGSTGIIIPMGDDNHQNGARTTVTTVGEEQVVFTYSEAVSAFDTPPTFEGPGFVPIVTFNGTDEELDSPDNAFWSRAGAVFSVGAWVNLTDATNSTLLAKWNQTGGAREWQVWFAADDSFQFVLYDDTNNAQLGRLVNSATTENEWLFAVCTYDGSATNAGMNLYKQGVDADDANGNSGSFTNMVAGAATLTLGFKVHPADIFNGLMAGGPLGPIFTHAELTADQVLELYQHDRALLGV